MSTLPRRFHLQRDHDVTGASRTGIVAHGVMWPDGTASVRWCADEDTSIAFWDKGVASAERKHEHGGHTRIIWDDEPAPDPVLPPGGYRLNGPGLWARLDAQRRRRGMSWRAVTRETGRTTNAIFTRLQRGSITITADALLSFLAWLGDDIDPGLITPRGRDEALATDPAADHTTGSPRTPKELAP